MIFQKIKSSGMVTVVLPKFNKTASFLVTKKTLFRNRLVKRNLIGINLSKVRLHFEIRYFTYSCNEKLKFILLLHNVVAMQTHLKDTKRMDRQNRRSSIIPIMYISLLIKRYNPIPVLWMILPSVAAVKIKSV